MNFRSRRSPRPASTRRAFQSATLTNLRSTSRRVVMKDSLRLLSALATSLLLGTVLALGQAVTGSIVGNVTDASGASVAGAKVTITETDTGIARTATTNSEGGYVVTYLQPGRYKVEVEKQ